MTMSEQECEHTGNGVWLRLESLQAMASVPCVKKHEIASARVYKTRRKKQAHIVEIAVSHCMCWIV